MCLLTACLNLCKSKVSVSCGFRGFQNITMNVGGSLNYKFQTSKLLYIFNEPVKGVGKVCGRFQDLKSPGPGSCSCLQQTAEVQGEYKLCSFRSR